MPPLKITEIKTLLVDGYYRNWVFVKMQTDEGIVGWGEASLEGKELAVQGAVADYSRILIGRSPLEIEYHLRAMTRDSFWMNGPVLRSAMGGLEMAMWDILGKSLGVPVYTLLGGKLRDSVETYSNAWYFGAKTPEEFAARARATVAEGYRALKFDPFGHAEFTQSTAELNESLAIITAVRQAVGPDVQLALDAHGRFSLNSALRLAQALEPYNLFFLEEPVHPQDHGALARLAQQSRVPLALGERCYSRWDYREILEARLVGLIQPDVIHVGGILELKKIAAAAETYGIAVAAHNAAGPVSTAATLQVIASVPNVQIQEMFAPHDAPWKDQIAVPPVRVVNGQVRIPLGPGLGIEIDEAVAAAHPYTPKDLGFYGSGSILERPHSKFQAES